LFTFLVTVLQKIIIIGWCIRVVSSRCRSVTFLAFTIKLQLGMLKSPYYKIQFSNSKKWFFFWLSNLWIYCYHP